MSPVPYLKVNAIYSCVQGEGAFTGTPMILVRFAGCHVGCPWCDSRETWEPQEPQRVASWDKLTPGGASWCLMTPRMILDAVRELGPRHKHLMLTGGEPCEQEIDQLINDAEAAGLSVHLETSGTAPIPAVPVTWITVSPKVGMPGGLRVEKDALLRANEIKMPVGKVGDITRLEELLRGIPWHHPLVYLQPIYGSKAALDLCLNTCKADGNYRLSIQTHKLTGEP